MNTRFQLNSFIVSFLACVLFTAYHPREFPDIWIDDARLDSETNSSGIDIERQEFSWKIKSEKRNRYQSAYQIVVLSENTKDTCWEQWNGYWSNIHSCFTSGGGWFYTGVAGIRQVENSVAFKHLLIIPQLTIEIPVNTKTDVIFPVSENEFVSELGKVLSSNSDIEILKKRKDNLRVSIISGKYIFSILKSSSC